MKRVADVVADILVEAGIEHVFMVTGGGAMHLNDAFGRNKSLKYAAFHHEQTCAMAADAYFRLKGKPACVNVTTGPGGTNALTGVFGAWTDSVGMVIISGQVKWETLVRGTSLPLRQLGDQEIDIVEMVRSITKYTQVIRDPNSIRYHLEKALFLSVTGRPGPVWIDIPIDVQASLVDPEALERFNPPEVPLAAPSTIPSQIEEVFQRLKSAERPVIMVGGGIRASGTHGAFLKFVEKLNIPVATCWNAHDVLWDTHPCYVGRPGSIGTRPGNFAVQNSDCLLILGSRLNIRQVSYNFRSFARHAYKIMVDVDRAELEKPTLNIDCKIHADLKDFFEVAEKIAFDQSNRHESWLRWCKERLKKYPAVLSEYWASALVNPYCFVDQLFKNLDHDDWIVTGDGTACVVTFQAAELKHGQRLFTNSGCASMGFDIPAAIGAFFAGPKNRLVCLAGDGSIQMNIQDLQTIVAHKMPAKIFVFNNCGYHSIRQTQKNFFPDNIVGCGAESGLTFPEMEKLALAYGIGYSKITCHDDLHKIPTVLDAHGPQICEVILDLNQVFSPRLSSRKLPDGKMITSPLEDMSPFLSREELKENMFYPVGE